MGAPPVLSRALPSDTGSHVFEDNGCKVYPRCLSCPLPRCVLTLQEDAPTMTREELKEQATVMHALGVSVPSLASYFTRPRWFIEKLLT